MFCMRYLRLFRLNSQKTSKSDSYFSNDNICKKIENRVTFEINSRCFVELSTSDAMKLLGSTQNKMEMGQSKTERDT